MFQAKQLEMVWFDAQQTEHWEIIKITFHYENLRKQTILRDFQHILAIFTDS